METICHADSGGKQDLAVPPSHFIPNTHSQDGELSFAACQGKQTQQHHSYLILQRNWP